MSNNAILEMVKNSYRGFTQREQEIIAKQVNGLPARSKEERELYERYRNRKSDSK